MRRRSFFGTAFAGLGSVASARPPKPAAGDIPQRPLGRTGQKLSLIGLGGARSQMIPFAEGTQLVQRAYDMGINYFDMARTYGGGRNEEVCGAAIQPFRKNVFVTTKSGKRTRQEAEAELNTSLKTMKTDHVDLWQMHMLFSLQECLSYTLSLPVTAVTLGVTTLGQLEDDVRIARNFKPLSSGQMDALRARAVAERQDVTNGPPLKYWKKKI